MMDFRDHTRKLYPVILKFGDFGIRILWHLLHFLVSLWYLGLSVATAVESYVVSMGLLKRYSGLEIGRLRYLAVVVESEDACRITEVIKLLQWLMDVGVKRVCLYDPEGVLKKSKDLIIGRLKNATLFVEADESNLLVDHPHITLEFASLSDGKEAVVKAANLLFMKYWNLSKSGKIDKEGVFTEANLAEALQAVGGGGPEPDLLLVYGPARCHLGFPAWRIRYTEIVHMGPLKSMRRGSLIKAIYRFTMVHQNYGK